MVRHRKPKYVHAYLDRHGRPRIYFNKPGQKRIALPGPLYSQAFWTAYEKAKDGKAETMAPVQKATTGTINALIEQYFQSPGFVSKAATTQSTYRNQLERFRVEHGTKPVASVTTAHLDVILGKVAMGSTAQGHKLRKRLGMLFRLAVKWNYRGDNPMALADRVQHKAKGYAPWTEGDIAKFRAHWKVGSPQRIAFEILLFTGLRRSDAVLLGRQHIQGDRIVTKIIKSGEQVELNIPIHPQFQAVLDTIKHGHLNFIVTERGAPRSEKAFTNWVIEAARDAGLPPHRSPHGLRKSACIRLAEAQCSASEIMAITGHRNLQEVETYVREANKKRLADNAIAKAYGAS